MATRKYTSNTSTPIKYDPKTNYQSLINNTSTSNSSKLNELYKARAAQIYGEGKTDQYASVPEQFQYLQDVSPEDYKYWNKIKKEQENPAPSKYSEKTTYTDQITQTLGDLADMLKTPLAYDSRKDEAYQAAQEVIKKDVYKSMARRGISDSSLTPQQQYQLSMQALPQFQANWYNQQQQGIGNKFNMVGQLQSLGQDEFNRRQQLEQLQLQKGQLTGDYLTVEEAKLLENIDPALLQYSDNLQAEINRRSAINPNDPVIIQLEYLRNKKISDQMLGYPKSILGQQTQEAIQNEWSNQFQQAQLTGDYLTPQQQRAADNGVNSEDRKRIDAIVKNMDGGYQEYMNSLNPNSIEYIKAQALRNEKIARGNYNYEQSYGNKTLTSKQFDLQKQEFEMNQKLRAEELEAARTNNQFLAKQLQANLSSTQLSNVGQDIANQISQINLGYLPQEKQLAVKQIQQALRMGNLQEAQQMIINANLPDKLEADLQATLAGIGQSYAQTGNINVDTALKAYGGAGSGVSGLIAIANKWVGTPYLWGGTGKGGIDCSAFTRKVFNEYGVKLTGNTQSQVKQGKAVKKGELQPGDLIFFNTNRTNGHVGIYIGGNQFMHASSSKGVTTSSLDNSYYKARYSTARRILK